MSPRTWRCWSKEGQVKARSAWCWSIWLAARSAAPPWTWPWPSPPGPSPASCAGGTAPSSREPPWSRSARIAALKRTSPGVHAARRLGGPAYRRSSRDRLSTRTGAGHRPAGTYATGGHLCGGLGPRARSGDSGSTLPAVPGAGGLQRPAQHGAGALPRYHRYPENRLGAVRGAVSHGPGGRAAPQRIGFSGGAAARARADRQSRARQLLSPRLFHRRRLLPPRADSDAVGAAGAAGAPRDRGLLQHVQRLTAVSAQGQRLRGDPRLDETRGSQPQAVVVAGSS